MRESDSNDNLDYLFPNESYEDNEKELDLKTISLEEYKMLMNLIPEVEKLRNSIKKITTVIQLKDQQLKKQRQAYQTEQTKSLNVSHLSSVSLYIF